MEIIISSIVKVIYAASSEMYFPVIKIQANFIHIL